jgi:hypothetical protein
MSYQDKLLAKIYTMLDRLEAEKQHFHAGWIAHAICSDHNSGLRKHDDAEFWRFVGYKATRELVRRCINKRTGLDEEERSPKQASLPGFRHLQEYYLVDRDGDQVGVHRDRMTDDEIVAKAALYRVMGDACHAHADELVRYMEERARCSDVA